MKRSTSALAASALFLLITPFGTSLVGNSQDQTAAKNSAELLTLDQALDRASANSAAFATAKAERQALALERTNARTALLPTATYHNQAIYTKPNGSTIHGQPGDAPGPIFIANNAVREYASQGVFNETLGFAQIGAIRTADANAARAAAELEVARRGLVNTVVALYYGVVAGDKKLDVAQQAAVEADHFLEITQKREAAREVAHADVLKALLQQQQRQREMSEAQLAASKARLELGVLIFAEPDTPFALAPLPSPVSLPDRQLIESLAQKNNPELRSALATVQISAAETYSAKAALLPDLALNFTYGIDATNVAVNAADGKRNLGYSMSAQLDIPVWNWLSTERKIKQSRLREGAARVALTAAQRRLVANLSEYYAEAVAAQKQLDSFDVSAVTASESLRLTHLRYVDGESTALEVVDAQTTLTSAENAAIDARTRYELALANLQTLTGKL